MWLRLATHALRFALCEYPAKPPRVALTNMQTGVEHGAEKLAGGRFSPRWEPQRIAEELVKHACSFAHSAF